MSTRRTIFFTSHNILRVSLTQPHICPDLLHGYMQSLLCTRRESSKLQVGYKGEKDSFHLRAHVCSAKPSPKFNVSIGELHAGVCHRLGSAICFHELRTRAGFLSSLQVTSETQSEWHGVNTSRFSSGSCLTESFIKIATDSTQSRGARQASFIVAPLSPPLHAQVLGDTCRSRTLNQLALVPCQTGCYRSASD
jgi:hypothetical protein